MRMINRILTVFLAVVTMATSAHAVPAACKSELYRRAHPEKCTEKKSNSFLSRNAIWIGGGAVAAGAVALVAMAAGGGSSSGATAHVQSTNDSNFAFGAPNVPQYSLPTLSIYNRVGYTDPKLLAAARKTTRYARNAAQYEDIRLAYSLARGYTGKNSTIAILDTGDYGYHGTAVKNIAGGAIAPDVKINEHKIVDNHGEFITYDKIANIIANDTSANIFNASWGTESQAGLNAATIKNRAQIVNLTSESFVNEITSAAQNRDAIFVWAAGNDHKSQSTALAAMPLVVPELDGHFINVVAWDSRTNSLADYSNACGATQMYCITAPGTDMNVGIGSASGTSFAAPIVSAAVAVIREAFPYMTAGEITSLLFTTARDLGTPGVDEIYGWGMLDLERATRPVGATLVSIDDNVMAPMQTARAAGVIGRQIKSANLRFAFFDSFGRAFDAKLNDSINFRPMGRAIERVRGNADMSVSLGNMDFGFTRSNLLASDGFLRTGERDLMGFVGMRGEMMLGDVRLFQRTRMGFSAPTAARDSMIREFSNIISASVTLGATYGDWTFTVGAPETIVSGDMTLRLATGRAADGQIQYRNHRVSLVETRPAMEYTAKYKFITAGYIDNPSGTDEFYVMARGQVSF